jgi:hypothetical protein
MRKFKISPLVIENKEFSIENMEMMSLILNLLESQDRESNILLTI